MYKFVTREEIELTCKRIGYINERDLLWKLLAERDELLAKVKVYEAEHDAEALKDQTLREENLYLLKKVDTYREVAINHLNLYDFHNSEKDAYDYIDAEAARIVEGKK